jgi:hypothetical protein
MPKLKKTAPLSFPQPHGYSFSLNALMPDSSRKIPDFHGVFLTSIIRPTATRSTRYTHTSLYSRPHFEPKNNVMVNAMDKKETWLAH